MVSHRDSPLRARSSRRSSSRYPSRRLRAKTSPPRRRHSPNGSKERATEYHFSRSIEVSKSTLQTFRYAGTDYFQVRGCKEIQYFVEIRHDPDQRRGKPNVGIFLKLVFPEDVKIRATYIISIPSTGFTTSINHDYDKSSSKGDYCFHYGDIMSSSNKYFIDNRMNLKIHGMLIVEPKEIREVTPGRTRDVTPVQELIAVATIKEPAATMDDDFKYDFTIITEGKPINAHKSVLKRNFSKFDEVFEGQHKKFRIDEEPYVVVRTTVGYCYGMDIPELSSQNLVLLWNFSIVCGFPELKAKAELKFAQRITEDNCVELANYLVHQDFPELKKSCIEYLVKERRANNLNIKFDNLSDDIFSEIHRLI